MNCYHPVRGMRCDSASQDGGVRWNCCQGQSRCVGCHSWRINGSKAPRYLLRLCQANCWLKVVVIHVRNVIVHYLLLHNSTLQHHLSVLVIFWELGHEPWASPCSIHLPDTWVPLHQRHQLRICSMAEDGRKLFVHLGDQADDMLIQIA